MICVVCRNGCGHALRVSGEVRDVDVLVGQHSDYWPDRYTCFHCGGPANGFLTPECAPEVMAMLVVVDVTADEAFAALNGMGVPEERTCCAEVVLPYFEKQGLKIKGKQPRGTQRYIIDEIEFPDGTRMYLAPSPQGATIYRIRKPHSYVQAMEPDNAG